MRGRGHLTVLDIANHCHMALIPHASLGTVNIGLTSVLIGDDESEIKANYARSGHYTSYPEDVPMPTLSEFGDIQSDHYSYARRGRYGSAVNSLGKEDLQVWSHKLKTHILDRISQNAREEACSPASNSSCHTSKMPTRLYYAL